uniref:Uncharacterized protein n=1 Tax=Panagrellus redivivus TaxID=6233 RepID=A0A7E4UQL0_PANRE
MVSLDNMTDHDDDFDETYKFYLELATFETQRWLQEITGEPNLDEDDLPKSLRESKQLRLLINILLRDEVFLFNEPSSTSAIFDRCRLRYEYESLIADDDWISQFLVIANVRLRIFPKYLFRHSDLCPVDKGSKPQLSPQSQRSIESPLRCPQQDALRRICVTVIKLAVLYEKQQQKSISRLKFFDSAAKRLTEFHCLLLDNNPCNLHIVKRRNPKFEPRQIANKRIIENKNMLPRFLNDLPTVERDTPTLPKTPPSTMNHAPDPTTPRVITTRRLSTYNETPVPQPFVQPANQLSATMAEQAVKQTSIMERQKKERSQLKEKVMLNNNEDEVFQQVTEWRNRRRMRVQSVESATVASPLSMPLHVNQPNSRQIHYRSYFNSTPISLSSSIRLDLHRAVRSNSRRITQQPEIVAASS